MRKKGHAAPPAVILCVGDYSRCISHCDEKIMKNIEFY